MPANLSYGMYLNPCHAYEKLQAQQTSDQHYQGQRDTALELSQPQNPVAQTVEPDLGISRPLEAGLSVPTDHSLDLNGYQGLRIIASFGDEDNDENDDDDDDGSDIVLQIYHGNDNAATNASTSDDNFNCKTDDDDANKQSDYIPYIIEPEINQTCESINEPEGSIRYISLDTESMQTQANSEPDETERQHETKKIIQDVASSESCSIEPIIGHEKQLEKCHSDKEARNRTWIPCTPSIIL
jgi:hypothetical protein